MISSRTRDPLFSAAMLLGIAVIVLVLFSLRAHADPVGAATQPVATDWTGLASLISLLLGGFATILGGVSVILHAIAPRTKTTADDKLAAAVDAVHDDVQGAHDKLDQVLAIVKPAAKVGMLAILLLGVLAGPALTGCTSASRGAAATDAKTAVVNCTGQALGTTPALDLATLAAIANTVVAERSKCTPPGGSLSWSCVESDALGEGKVIGGCSIVQLIASAVGQPSSGKLASAAAVSPGVDPGRAVLERFRARVAGGATFHASTGDY